MARLCRCSPAARGTATTMKLPQRRCAAGRGPQRPSVDGCASTSSGSPSHSGNSHHPRAQRPHCRVRVFAKKYGMPVFASQGTLLAMDSSPWEKWNAGFWRTGSSWRGWSPPPSPPSPRQRPIPWISHPHRRWPAICPGNGPGSADGLCAGAPLGGGFVVIESNHDKEMLRAGPILLI